MTTRSSPIRFEAKTRSFLLSEAAARRVEAAIAALNPEQRDAVLAPDGPVLVEAGAGTGKTKVLTTRIARAIALGHAVPERILAVTFTNKSAAEMRERLGLLIGEEAASEVCLGSFHAVSLAMLRRHAREAGLRDEDFRIYDEGDQLIAMYAAMERAGIRDTWSRPGATTRDRSEHWMRRAQQFLEQVQSWKDEGRTIADVEDEIARTGPQANDPAMSQALEIYRAYQAELDRRNAVDFADIILRMTNLFRHSPKVRAHWSNRFSMILVDEFQDTDGVQYEWLQALAEHRRNIFAVGDLDQCIYEWRNARPDIFAGFAEDWDGCLKVRLHRNYRSTQPILDVASDVVERASGRVARTRLKSESTGDAVALKVFDTHIEESDWIAADIEKRIAFGAKPSEIAILFRQAKDMSTTETALAHAGIPYAIASGTRFHKRDEIKDIIAWIALAVDTTDEISFIRAARRPARGIEDQTIDRVLETMRRGVPTNEALRQVGAFDDYASNESRAGLGAIAVTLDYLVTKVSDGPGALIRAILADTGYVEWRRRANLAEEDLDDIMETLVDQADAFAGTVPQFLQEFAILSEADTPTGDGVVRISTIHAAKGLEWDVVYTPCLEEGILPNDRALKHDRFIEEERRILHVGWTRARQILIPSCVRNRRYKPSQASRFLIDAKLMDNAGAQLARNVTRYATTKTIKRIKLNTGE